MLRNLAEFYQQLLVATLAFLRDLPDRTYLSVLVVLFLTVGSWKGDDAIKGLARDAAVAVIALAASNRRKPNGSD